MIRPELYFAALGCSSVLGFKQLILQCNIIMHCTIAYRGGGGGKKWLGSAGGALENVAPGGRDMNI